MGLPGFRGDLKFGSRSGPVFLPAAGPFAGLTPKLASSVSDRTISSNTNLSSLSSRTAPLEYNTLTISGGIISAPTSYYIAIRCNVLNLTGGTIDLSGNNGYTTGSGGDGACGGGGGGGSGTPCSGCETNQGGAGGAQLGPALLDGSPGSDGSGSSGKQGGIGYAINWKTDGYNYVADLGGNFLTVTNQPFLWGGNGGSGGNNPCAVGPYTGGNGGGAGGGLIIQAGKIIGNGTTVIKSTGGGAETGSDGTIAEGGDGGWLWIGAVSYPSTILNGKLNVSADSFGTNNGVAKFYKITGGTYTTASVGTPF